MASAEQKAAAHTLVSEFRSRDSRAWSAIDRTRFADGVDARIDDPSKISSAGSSLCGPAAVSFNLASADPAAYAKFAIALYESGRGQIKSTTYKASSSLRGKALPAGNAEADWVVLGSLRDDDNWVFTYDGQDSVLNVGEAAAITLPHSMSKWFGNCGYTDLRNETNLVTNKDWDNLRAANKLLAAGYKVSLFVNADVLYTSKQDSSGVIPDHWIGLQTKLVSSTNVHDPLAKVSGQIFSWGQVRELSQDPEKKVSVKQFLAHYYGYVAGKP